MIKSGYFPTTLRIFSNRPETFKVDPLWGRGWWRSHDKEIVHEVKGRPAFVVDSESKEYVTLVESWLNSHPNPVPYSDTVDRFDDACGDMYEDVVNTSFTSASVVSIEVRGGGHVYRVRTPDGYIYDLCEDQLLEAMFEVGVERGAILGGEWLWGLVESQMTLVRVGSKLYSDIMTVNRRTPKKVRSMDLTTGTVYTRESGSRHVFLGFVKSYGRATKHQLWWDFNPLADPEHLQKYFDNAVSNRRAYYTFKMIKSHSCVDSCGTINIPSDIIERVQKVWYERAMLRVDSFTSRRDEALRHRNPKLNTTHIFDWKVLCPNPEKVFDKGRLLEEASMHAYDMDYTPTDELVAAIAMSEQELTLYATRRESGFLNYYSEE